jgi:hypothetical protein
MSSDYKSFGCFIDNSNTIFPTNMTKITGKNYSIEECANEALNNKSMVFGITGKYPNEGTCLLSDPNETNLDQVYGSIKEGLIFDGCPENFGTKENNSVAVFVNNNALSFFNDIQVTNIVNKSDDMYSDILEKINDDFYKMMDEFTIKASKEFKPYTNNNISTLFNSTNSNSYLLLNQEYEYLDKKINNENTEIYNKIKKLNDEIQNLDNMRVNAENRLNNIISSDNAAVGNVPDVNFRGKTVVIENIALILIAFIIVVLCAIPKTKKVVEKVAEKVSETIK